MTTGATTTLPTARARTPYVLSTKPSRVASGSDSPIQDRRYITAPTQWRMAKLQRYANTRPADLLRYFHRKMKTADAAAIQRETQKEMGDEFNMVRFSQLLRRHHSARRLF